MSNAFDTLTRYTDGVERGAFDADLSPEDRAAVVRLLRMGCAILRDFGGTPRDDLARMIRDPYQSRAAVNERVRDILTGCMS